MEKTKEPDSNIQEMTKIIESHIMREMASDRKWSREDRKRFAKASNKLYRQSVEIGKNLL